MNFIPVIPKNLIWNPHPRQPIVPNWSMRCLSQIFSNLLPPKIYIQQGQHYTLDLFSRDCYCGSCIHLYYRCAR